MIWYMQNDPFLQELKESAVSFWRKKKVYQLSVSYA